MINPTTITESKGHKNYRESHAGDGIRCYFRNRLSCAHMYR